MEAEVAMLGLFEVLRVFPGTGITGTDDHDASGEQVTRVHYYRQLQPRHALV